MINVRCGECGNKRFELQNVKGSFYTTYKDYPIVFVVTDLELNRCGECGNDLIQSKDEAEKITAAAKKSITIQINLFVDVIVKKTKTKKKDLAQAIGKSATYLSEILNGDKIPAYSVWNDLKQIATNPDRLDDFKPDYKFDKTPLFKAILMNGTGTTKISNG